MHKLTSITYLIASLPKKHNQKMTRNCLFIPSGNSYSPSSFVIFQRGYVPIFPSSWAKTCRKMFALWKIRIYDRLYRGLYEKKMLKINIYGHFLSKRPLKNFPKKPCLTIIWLTIKILKIFIIGTERLHQRLPILHFWLARALTHVIFRCGFNQFSKLKTSVIQKMETWHVHVSCK